MTNVRRKILFLLPSLEGGGAERVFVTLLRHLSRDSFELHLGLLQAAGPYLPEVPSDVRVHVLSVRRARYALPAIVRLIWRIRPRVVISTPVNLNLIVAASKPFWPSRVRLFIRESITLSYFLEEEVRQPRLWKFVYRLLYGRADCIVSLCEAMSRDMCTSFQISPKKLIQIYNPVDSERLQQLTLGSSNPYQTAGPNLVAVGRLENQKGFDLLLDAMAVVCRSCPSARLTILGEGSLRAQLEDQRDALGLKHSVCLPGFQENPFPYYQWADLFVLISKYEGLPNAMLEAIALGTPALATTECSGGVQEIAELLPEFTVLCKRGSSNIAEQILAAFRDGTVKAMSFDSIRGRFESTFGVGTVVKRYTELLRSDQE